MAALPCFIYQLRVCIVLLLLSPGCLPKIISGSIDTKANWAFVARFCFKNSYGQLQYRFHYPKEYAVQNILLYFDSQWSSVYPKYTMSCLDKEGKLIPKNNQVINLTTSYVWSGCELITTNTSRDLLCKEDRRFLSFRARWWYIVVSNCKSQKGLKLSYSMTLINGDSFWVKHFSADEQHILEVDIGVLIYFVILLLIGIYVAWQLVCRRLFHYTYKLFMLSLVCEVLSLILYISYYVEYGKTGIENYIVKVLARGIHSVSHICFLLLLILLGKGWTVTRGQISSGGQIKLSTFCTLYTVCFGILFVFEASVFDPGKVLYIYESPAGIGICVLRVIAWLWFCYGTFFTLKHFPGKSSFYYPFWFFYTGWFLAGPVIVVISTFVIEKWQREQTVNGIDWAVSMLAHTFFLVITRPSAANKNFPFHIRTNQIGIVEMSLTKQSGPHENGVSAAIPNDSSYGANGYSTNASYYEGKFTDITSMFMAKSTGSSNKQHYTTSQGKNTSNGFEMSTLNFPSKPSAPPQ